MMYIINFLTPQHLTFLCWSELGPHLDWPECRDNGGREMHVGPGEEEVADSRRDEHSIDQSIERLQTCT